MGRGGWTGSSGLTCTHCSLLKLNALRKVSIIKQSLISCSLRAASQMALVVKNPPTNAGIVRGGGSISGSGTSLEEGKATHSQILAWRMPRTEEPGGLRSMRSQRGGQDWKTARNSSVPAPCFPLLPRLSDGDRVLSQVPAEQGTHPHCPCAAASPALSGA